MNTKYILLFGLLLISSVLSGDIGSCQNLNVPDTTYTLNQSVVAVGNCFNITANNVTLDCDIYNITGPTSDYGLYITSDNVTVQNCNMTDFDWGIYINGSSNVELTGLNSSGNPSGSLYAIDSNNILVTAGEYSSSAFGIGIQWDNVTNSEISEAVLFGHSTGIDLDNCDNINFTVGVTSRNNINVGISITNSNDIFSDASNSYSNAIEGFLIQNVTNSIFDGDTSQHNSYGVSVNGGSNNINFTDGIYYNSSVSGILIDSASEILFDNFNSSYSTVDGIETSSNSVDITFQNGFVQNNTRYGLNFLGGQITVDNTTFAGQIDDTIRLAGTLSDFLILNNNNIRFGEARGITLSPSLNLTMNGNNFYDFNSACFYSTLSSNINLDNNIFEKCNSARTDPAAFYSQTTQLIDSYNDTVYDSFEMGVYLNQTDNSNFNYLNSTLNDFIDFYAENSENLTVQHGFYSLASSIAGGNTYGMRLFGLTNAVINNNTMYNNTNSAPPIAYGLTLESNFLGNNYIDNNTISFQNFGVFDVGLQMSQTTGGTMRLYGNTIYNNTFGVLYDQGNHENETFTDGLIYNNTDTGISITGMPVPTRQYIYNTTIITPPLGFYDMSLNTGQLTTYVTNMTMNFTNRGIVPGVGGGIIYNGLGTSMQVRWYHDIYTRNRYGTLFNTATLNQTDIFGTNVYNGVSGVTGDTGHIKIISNQYTENSTGYVFYYEPMTLAATAPNGEVLNYAPGFAGDNNITNVAFLTYPAAALGGGGGGGTTPTVTGIKYKITFDLPDGLENATLNILSNGTNVITDQTITDNETVSLSSNFYTVKVSKEGYIDYTSELALVSDITLKVDLISIWIALVGGILAVYIVWKYILRR